MSAAIEASLEGLTGQDCRSANLRIDIRCSRVSRRMPANSSAFDVRWGFPRAHTHAPGLPRGPIPTGGPRVLRGQPRRGRPVRVHGHGVPVPADDRPAAPVPHRRGAGPRTLVPGGRPPEVMTDTPIGFGGLLRNVPGPKWRSVKTDSGPNPVPINRTGSERASCGRVAGRRSSCCQRNPCCWFGPPRRRRHRISLRGSTGPWC